MKRLLLSIAFSIIAGVAAFAISPAIRNIDITVHLTDNGSAKITEIWDVTVASGTEWYLVRSNLGDIAISNLSVSDETSEKFMNEGDWDIDRSIREKAGRCGMVNKGSDGYEICWGVGSYGDHVYTVSYTLTNFVKSLNDYDAFNYQFISTGLSSNPDYAKVTISKEGTPFDSTAVRIAGFGYIGEIIFQDGNIVARTTEPFRSNSSMIVMARFDKGIFSPTSIQDRDFSEMEEMAISGSDYEIEEPLTASDVMIGIVFVLLIFVLPIVVIILFLCNKTGPALRKSIYGVNPDKLDWCRELPYNGDLLATYYTLTVSKMVSPPNSIASAFILDMLYNKNLEIKKDLKGKDVICIGECPENVSKSERRLYNMMKAASGKDGILQEKEFKKWLRNNQEDAIGWTNSLKIDGVNSHVNMGSVFTKEIVVWKKSHFNPKGKELARKAIGFKNFLKDFTLINERKSVEVSLWREYIIFGALFGIADKVAKELKEIDPIKFEQLYPSNGIDILNTLNMSNLFSNSITASQAAYNTRSTISSWGGGGLSSFGGGGGFSGGGHGGGSR
ncbi:MAG: DUF2207 domain-containing protein [Bacteroidales bacterium]|nr:DUF2207 domain-containing protein [Bacteroidales bacterium]MDD4670471.1 DUF2207 domain-containing protein [Bacteroidales bacterium]